MGCVRIGDIMVCVLHVLRVDASCFVFVLCVACLRVRL
jgi:hypothetical protein